jgi:hypothetical protein
MPGNGTHAFTEPGDYEASLCGAKIDLVVTGRGRFKVVLTWAELRQLHLLCSQEDLASIAYVELPAHLAYVAFPTRFDPPPIWGGVKLRPGNIVFHSCGELMHNCSTGLSQKGFISFTPERLAIWSYALAEEELVPPPSARIIRPSVPASARLLYLHAEASRLVEESPGIIAHPEVTRALEQELTCTDPLSDSRGRPRL